MTKTEAERKAQAMMDQIKAGKTIFTKAADAWMVIGPAADVVEGAIVTATRQSGTESQVRIVKVHTTATRQGVTYATATFRNVVAAEPVKAAADTYRVTAEHPIGGRGRRYASQPGATQYDDGSGKFAVQIWDNA